MAMNLLHLSLLLVLLSPSRAKDCDECIQSGHEAAWCTGPRIDNPCNNVKELEDAGCLEDHIYNPQGALQLVKNDNSIDPEDAKTLFIQPQEVSIHLRPGVPQSFPFTITLPSDKSITELTLVTSSVPVGVNISLNYLETGDPLVVQAKVEAASCPSESNQDNIGPWSIEISPSGSSLSIKLEISLDCKCECSGKLEENSLQCGGNGALVCGQCKCNAGHYGAQCQFFAGPGEETCWNNPKAPLCNGRGMCVNGSCECERRENPEEKITGQYCECSNFGCPEHNNKVCGNQGKCECGKCVCDDTWGGDDCTCTTETASCMADGEVLCNGQGTCECGTCKCRAPFKGQTCESCPACFRCEEHAQCVQCRAFGIGSLKDRCDEECGYLHVITVPTKDDLPEPNCVTTSPKSCEIFYRISRTTTEVSATVSNNTYCPQK